MPAKPKIVSDTSIFFNALSPDRRTLSERTGIPCEKLSTYALRNTIPTKLAFVFLVECLARDVDFPAHLFGLIQPLQDRIKRAICNYGLEAQITLDTIEVHKMEGLTRRDRKV